MNDILSSYPLNDYRNYLQHHGILGQKKGRRRAPWYPIAAFEAHLRRIGEKPKENYSNRSSTSITSTSGAAYDRFKDRMLRQQIENAKIHVEKAQKSHEKIKYEKKLNELLEKANDRKNGRELTRKEWNFVKTQDPDVPLKEQKKALAEVEKEERETTQNRTKYLEENKERILQKGTMEEILSLAGIADNSSIAQAITNRQTLDKALNSVETNKKWEKMQPFIDNATKAAELASTISNLANKGFGAYTDVRNALKGAGLISDKKDDTAAIKLQKMLSGKDSTKITKNILKEALNGKFTKDELANYNSYLKELKLMEENSKAKEIADKAKKEFESLFSGKNRNEIANKVYNKAISGKLSKEKLTEYNNMLDTIGTAESKATELNKKKDQEMFKHVNESNKIFNSKMEQLKKDFSEKREKNQKIIDEDRAKAIEKSYQYKTNERIRDIAKKIRENGYASLSDLEKELYRKTYHLDE